LEAVDARPPVPLRLGGAVDALDMLRAALTAWLRAVALLSAAVVPIRVWLGEAWEAREAARKLQSGTRGWCTLPKEGMEASSDWWPCGGSA
jgi:hypothetical protein